jgi:hypothetical protein
LHLHGDPEALGTHSKQSVVSKDVQYKHNQFSQIVQVVRRSTQPVPQL